MKKILPVLIITSIILFFFKPVIINGLLPIPADTIVGLYNPYRDFYAPAYPRGIPFKNFLITDPVRQEYPWRNLAISIEKNFELPLWNPYTFAGVPLLGNLQSAALYPLNIFFFILPFSFGWSVLIILEPVLAGVFLYWYLRKMNVSIPAGIIGAITFAFSGVSVAWLEWNTLLHVVLWLPLILLAKEYLLTKISSKWICVLLFAESAAVFAGHAQFLLYSFCISNAYLLARIIQNEYREKGKHRLAAHVVRKYVPFLFIGITVVLITVVQWLPFFQFIWLSARESDQSLWQQPGWFIPWQNIVQFIAPDFFGNPVTLNYWGIFNYAEFVGYVGIIPLIMASIALFFRRDTKTLFFGSLFFLSLLCAFPTLLAQLPFFLHIPLLSTSQPTRLLFVTDFSLAVLSALGFDTFMKNKKTVLAPLSFFAFCFCGLWLFVSKGSSLFPFLSSDMLLVTKHNIILPSIIFAISAVVLCGSIYTGQVLKKKNTIIIALLLVSLTLFDLFRFAEKFIPFTPRNYLYPQTKSITFLQHQVGNYRIMTTDSRLLPPNFSVMYHIQSVDGYDPLFLQEYAEVIIASERGTPDIHSPFGFNRIITPHRYNSTIMDLLGVKYVLSLSDISSDHMQKVFQEGETRIYQNQHVLPRAFFVAHIISSHTLADTIRKVFSLPLRTTAVVTTDEQLPTSAYAQGTVAIAQYTENRIRLQTKNTGDGFLVLTDTYYPSWHAFIDGKETRIYKADYSFRGIFVPKGSHTIIFQVTLF